MLVHEFFFKHLNHHSFNEKISYIAYKSDILVRIVSKQ